MGNLGNGSSEIVNTTFSIGDTNQGQTIGSANLPEANISVDSITFSNNPTIKGIDNKTILANDGLISLNSNLNNVNLTVSSLTTGENINAIYSPMGLQVAGVTEATLDANGDLITNGWVYIKGRNRIYQQNLTAFTTTSTTSAVLINSANNITPKFSGHIIIEGIFRVSNNTVGDGIYIGLTINGNTVDSETYTQEGLASNEHTMVFHYELTSQAIGTSITIGFKAKAITGGTASAKMVSFICEEI